MSNAIECVGGWEIRRRPDGGYGVYDAHGLIEGPFGSKAAAMQAAAKLPKIGLSSPSHRRAAHPDR